MKYFSTRNSSEKITASQAIAKGLAGDGGLFVPESFPKVDIGFIGSLCALDYRERAAKIMGLYLDEFSEKELADFTAAAYADNYDSDAVAPTEFVDEGVGVLELWHGPTCAFKDMALQILPYLLTASLRKNDEKRNVCILVATSGDTGKAALEGFKDVDGTSILVFYPRDGVSDVQKLQMVSQSGRNVCVSAVAGNFDDAQTGVKNIFSDKAFAERLNDKGYFLSSANSINWGRLLPQIVYYFSAYCDCVKRCEIKLGDEIIFSVPTGNFGDILAGWYAKQMGLPVKKFICASNENNVLTDFIETGIYDRNRTFHTTISPSMDILVSSNLERLLYSVCGSDKEVARYMSELNTVGKYEVSDSVKAAISRDFAAGWCDDAETKAQIAETYNDKGYLMDTHTAVAYKVLGDYRKRTGDKTFAVVVSTASPFKFCDSVLDALGENSSAPGTELIDRLSERCEIAAPAPLSGLAQREVRFPGCVEKQDMMAFVDSFLS